MGVSMSIRDMLLRAAPQLQRRWRMDEGGVADLSSRPGQAFEVRPVADHPRDKDDRNFREAVADARPLKQDRVAPYRRKRKPTPEQKLIDERLVMESLLADEFDAAELETGQQVLCARPGVH